jgi:hypothetical protein
MLRELLAQMRQAIIGNNNNSIIGNNNNINNIYDNTKRLPSDLANIVNILGKKPVGSYEEGETKVYEIEIKIAHNKVIGYVDIIKEYKIWSGKLAAVYAECEERGTNKTENMLANIKQHYMKVKGELLLLSPDTPHLEVVRINADEIFRRVEARLYEEIVTSSNISSSKDELNNSLQAIIVDAFIRCKILEHP